MIIPSLIDLFDRDLTQARKEVEAYNDENDLWIVKNGIANSAGNLCLHLNGNLQHFIGAVLGKTGYVRDREAEFASKNIPQSDMLSLTEKTREVVRKTLETLPESTLTSVYPINIFKKEMTTGFFLMHLATHLGYHLGQINYHRRLLGRAGL